MCRDFVKGISFVWGEAVGSWGLFHLAITGKFPTPTSASAVVVCMHTSFNLCLHHAEVQRTAVLQLSQRNKVTAALLSQVFFFIVAA